MVEKNIKLTFSGLSTFLNRYKGPGGEGYRTHTSIGGGCWCLPRDKFSEFHDLYHEHVFEKKINDRLSNLTEVPLPDCSPIKVDIDLRWISEDLERIYNVDLIKTLLRAYYDAIEEVINYSDKMEYQSFVFEKSVPNRTGKRSNENKDGIHIMFPYFNVVGEVERIVRDKVIAFCKERKIFDSLKLTNSLSDVIDIAVISRNNWQMYGSSKPKCEAYKLTHIYTIDADEDEIVEVPIETGTKDNGPYTNRVLLDLLSIRYRRDGIGGHKTMIKKDIRDKIEAKNIMMYGGEIDIRAKKVLYKKPKWKRAKKTKLGGKELKMVCNIVDNLLISRSQSYMQWFNLGALLYNLHNNDNQLFDKWVEFSKKSTKHSALEAERSCKKYWEKFSTVNWTRPAGMPTLKLWLKVDNPAKYGTIISNELEIFILKSCHTGSSWDVSKVLWMMYRHFYVCAATKNQQWFHYVEDEHRWCELSKPTLLRKKISTELFQVYNKLQLKHAKRSEEAGDHDDEMRTIINKVMNKLKNTSFKENMLKECVEHFFDDGRKFYENLNSNLRLICFKNGVYDLGLSEFRVGRPEDYITKSTNIDYIEYDENDVDFMYYVKFLENMLRKMFPVDCEYCRAQGKDCELLEYILLLLSTFLDGSTRDEKFHIWMGSGANGKSLLVDLFSESLGDYACVLPETLLTEKRGSSSSASPQLFKTKGTRFVVLQEPEAKAAIQVGLLKQLTGGDKITCRGLWKEPETFKPQFKMVLTCNNLPKLPPKDGGVWRRVRATNFRSKFVDYPKGHWVNDKKERISVEEHNRNVEDGDEFSDQWIPMTDEYPKDNSLKERFREDSMYVSTFVSMLIERFKRYKKGELYLKEPACVLEFTRAYQLEQDKLKQFIDDRIDISSSDYKKPLRIELLYKIYLEWHAENYEGRSMNKRQLQREFESKYGKYADPSKAGGYAKRGWWKLQIKIKEDKTEVILEDDNGSLESFDVIEILNDSDDIRHI